MCRQIRKNEYTKYHKINGEYFGCKVQIDIKYILNKYVKINHVEINITQ